MIWYSRSRQQQRREPVLVVGVMLLIAATFLGYAGWHRATARSRCTSCRPRRSNCALRTALSPKDARPSDGDNFVFAADMLA